LRGRSTAAIDREPSSNLPKEAMPVNVLERTARICASSAAPAALGFTVLGHPARMWHAVTVREFDLGEQMTTSRQRHAVREYPFSEPGRLNLDPTYAHLREHEPVARVQMPYGEEAWLVTRYADVRTVPGDARSSRAAVVGRDEP